MVEAGDRSTEHMVSQILGDHYEVQQQLAKKSGCKTLLVRDLEKELVVVKLLSFSSDFEWDDLKLFEREAETLKSITHPCIPRYLDYFEINPHNSKGFALVQTYIEAKSLEEHLSAELTFSEADVHLYQDIVYTPMRSSDAPTNLICVLCANTHLLALRGTWEIHSALATFWCTKYDVKQSTSTQY
jgi:serine/threonine protein kinase